MRRLPPNGRGLAVQECGEGAAVLLLHPGFLADGMLPLFADDTLAAGRRLVRYHRRGYGHSGPAEPPVSLVQQAGDALAVLDALDIDRVDLVGHSFGGNVALELAIVAPERVRSLVLIEPLLAFALTPETARYVAEAAATAVPLYQRGDGAGAVDAWLARAFGSGYREVLERTLPGALDQATRDADAAFAVEMPSLQTWPRGPEDLRRISTRTLSVVNDGSDWPGFRETHDALLAWLPHIEAASVPNCGHLLQIERPAPVAVAVANFLSAGA